MTTSQPVARLIISTSELAAETLRRLRKARAAGRINFLAGYFESNPSPHEDSGCLVLILSPESLSDQANTGAIQNICGETGVENVLIEAVEELCLEGEPSKHFLMEVDTVTRIKLLPDHVDEAAQMRALVLPNYWVVAYFNQNSVNLNFGIRGNVVDSDASIIAHQLAAALERPIGLVIRGRTIEVIPAEAPADVWARVQSIPNASANFGLARTNMAQALRDLADSIDPTFVGDDAPDELEIFEQPGKDIPAGSFFYEITGLEVFFRYRADLD